MEKSKTITIQELRRNLPQVLNDIAAGRVYTVISHSRLVTDIGRPPFRQDNKKVGYREHNRRIVEAAARCRTSARGGLPPGKSYKQLYAEDEDMAAKYDIR